MMASAVPASPARHPDGGFSLLEVLVALTVLGFLMVGLNQGVRTGLSLLTMQSRQVATTADLDATARVLRKLLTAIPVSPAVVLNPGAGPLAISFNGTAGELSFVGDLPTGLGGTRLADITLSARGGRLVLAWAPHRHEVATAAPEAAETELLRGITHLELAYWGAGAPNVPPGWLARWEEKSLPPLIRIQVSFAKADPRQWPAMIVAPQLWTPEL